jgi:hypothetical protein
MSERVDKEFPTRAVFPATDLFDVDVVEGSGGVAVVDLNFLCRHFCVFFDWVFSGASIGFGFVSLFSGSDESLSE